MDLIYMNTEKEDIGVLKDYTLDLAFGTDENDFECTVSMNNHKCKAGYYLYYENAEYGGVIDSIEVDTNADKITYLGRTWQGILATKILEPDSGTDYLILSGEANTILSTLVSRMGLESLFKADAEDSGINISNYKMNRYISGYEGIRKMLKAFKAKLTLTFKNGFVVLSAKPFIDYSKDEQFDTDQIDFLIKKNYSPVNHVICLGNGDLKDRVVIHVYADKNGEISLTQSLTGIKEVTSVYDYPNSESVDELKQGGIDIIKNSWNSNELKFDFSSDTSAYDIGDIVGAKEGITGIEVNAEITKKIITIKDNTTKISYKVGE